MELSIRRKPLSVLGEYRLMRPVIVIGFFVIKVTLDLT
jgi:hypothetical protein